MKKAAMLCALMLSVLPAGCGGREEPKPKIEDIVQTRGSTYTCTFDGVNHDMILDMPENTESAPLVVMLPGYGQSAEDFRSTVHFEENANPLGYAVVYVTGAPDPTDRTSSVCWNSTCNPKSNKDAEFLSALALYLQKEYSLDKDRLYAAGFSNGAFMTHTLAAEAGDTFSACVSVAGKMQQSIWDKRGSSGSVSFMQITGSKDDLIPKNSDGTAEYSPDPAIEDVMSYWADSNGAVFTEELGIGKRSVLKKYENPDTRKQVWDVTVREGRHSWYAEQLHGFDTNDLILEFFEAQK